MKNLVIIVTYNSAAVIQDCLGSLTKSQVVCDFDLVVVDNNSDDNTVDLVKKIFPTTALILNKNNLGYGQAINQAVRRGLKQGYQIFAILNPDVQVDKNWLREIERVFDSREKTGIVQPLILLKSRPNRINTAGNSLHFLGFSFCQKYGQSIGKQKAADEEIPTASGACLVVKAEVFRRAGFFNRRFFLYFEDTDFSWRARLAGFEIWLAGQSRVWHDYYFKRVPQRYFYLERNRLWALLTNYQLRTLILIGPALILVELGLFIGALWQGWALAKLKSWLSIVLNSIQIHRDRQIVQGHRRLNDREIKKMLSTSFDFPPLNQPLIEKIFNPACQIYWRIIKGLV